MPDPRRPLIAARLRAAGCVFAEDEADVLIDSTRSDAELDVAIERRAAGQPLEHVVGWARFFDLRIEVGPGVFVPRVRTEFLVECALRRPARLAVDLCCGSGAVGVALMAARAGLELHAADIDPEATACARRNLPASACVHTGSLFDPLPVGLHGRVDLLTANVPYVPTDEIALLPSEAREHEPHHTLDGGAEGLDLAGRVTAQAPGWLRGGGRLLIESSVAQAPALAELFTAAGLNAEVAVSDELEVAVVAGTRP